jgi:hypothetical protein
VGRRAQKDKDRDRRASSWSGTISPKTKSERERELNVRHDDRKQISELRIGGTCSKCKERERHKTKGSKGKGRQL